MHTQKEILKAITNKFEQSVVEKDNNINEKPDIIITHNKTTFSVKIQIHMSIHTGMGGFKMFAEQMPGFDMLKIEYNNVILNLKEKQDLYLQTINYGTKLKQENKKYHK